MESKTYYTLIDGTSNLPVVSNDSNSKLSAEETFHRMEIKINGWGRKKKRASRMAHK